MSISLFLLIFYSQLFVLLVIYCSKTHTLPPYNVFMHLSAFLRWNWLFFIDLISSLLQCWWLRWRWTQVWVKASRTDGEERKRTFQWVMITFPSHKPWRGFSKRMLACVPKFPAIFILLSFPSRAYEPSLHHHGCTSCSDFPIMDLTHGSCCNHVEKKVYSVKPEHGPYPLFINNTVKMSCKPNSPVWFCFVRCACWINQLIAKCRLCTAFAFFGQELNLSGCLLMIKNLGMHQRQSNMWLTPPDVCATCVPNCARPMWRQIICSLAEIVCYSNAHPLSDLKLAPRGHDAETEATVCFS